MIPDTPQSLLKRIRDFKDGDDAAEWARFVELYEPVVRLYLVGRGDIGAADADDMVQEVFVRLVEVIRSGAYNREKGRFRSYLASMVRRLLIDRHRREMCRGAGCEVSVDEVEIASRAPDPAVIVDARLKAARRAAAVEHVMTRAMLDARTVAAFREYALEGLPAEEVAARHGLTLNALRQIKYRVGQMIAAVEAQYGE